MPRRLDKLCDMVIALSKDGINSSHEVKNCSVRMSTCNSLLFIAVNYAKLPEIITKQRRDTLVASMSLVEETV